MLLVEEKLNSLKKSLIQYASLVESMIIKSLHGLLKRDGEVLKELINKYEPWTNDLELEIEENATTFIAQHEPKAKDLRTVLMILKINNDLERIGDHVANIAESALFLIERPPVKPLIDIPKMAETVTKMLSESITAFMNEDSKLAKSVCEQDSIVDNLLEQIIRELITYMMADPKTIERSMHLIRIGHNLERIADLSTNISEDVIFIVEGKVIKHGRGEA
ncbi:MAG: phosphate signaling complex protein PhoU [candidate division WOR-3 bacterium]|nr:phosphate signaling complex protein PhoU [candidate division WOR-3 bacterium]MCX7757175.1 phosphate signaling complex protein PhoU [candidate division WOR-3 bacterium]MDW7988448.1 phosphate signaling complex protein PhoU [candidate division WOR-3 bacterium]